MLWYKSWLETRWRFLIGLLLLMFSAAGAVLAYPELVRLMPSLPKLGLGGEIGRRVAESMELARDYRGYLWVQWFAKSTTTWTLFAVLLGTGGLLSQTTGGGALFTLSLPVSRTRLLGVRTFTGLAELLVLAAVPSFLLPALSPRIGQTASVQDVLVHGACLFVAGSVFFSLTVLLSTVFSDVWRPLLFVLCGAGLLATLEIVFRGLSRYSVFRVMSGETYFRGGGLPWMGLLVSAAASLAILWLAARNIARQDF